MINLKLINPTWIDGSADNPDDQCAHGGIELNIDDLQISDGAEEYTTSGAALYLLRTIFHNHTPEEPVAEGNLLFPCCAFSPYKIKSPYGVVIVGCPNGLDFEIEHVGSSVKITHKEKSKIVSTASWALAVLNFTDQVLHHYSISTPKTIPADKEESEGWALFWSEVETRKSEATKIAEKA